MKYLSLQQAMLGMCVTMTDDGLILKSPAGSAHYDLKGRRHAVWGDASFFPEHLRVKDKRKPKGAHVSYGNGEIVGYRTDGSIAWRMGKFEEPTKTPKPNTSNDSIDVSKILDDAWRSGRPLVGEAVNDLAEAIANARACSQSYQQHASGGETTPSTYTVSIGINCNNEAHTSGIGSNIYSILKNALARDKAMPDFEETIRKAIQKECQPGGLIWNSRSR
ncbi:hypothetical protein [Citrobacter freundii]|uniref:hypothetical protein n=1 Tax=Citrobacter freundii TaxID=546 RepID=UPI001C8C25F2|nr:hypothetical protein [Citrobacter freundii]MBX8661751.1 hypothetical protein [Citrobacter freundii]